MRSPTGSVGEPEWKQCGGARTKLQTLALDMEYEYQPVAAAAWSKLDEKRASDRFSEMAKS